MKPRQLTDEEVREEFLHYIRVLLKYWSRKSLPSSLEERLFGLAHSLLSAIDGESVLVPGFALVPKPHPDDKKYHRKNGKNWYPEPKDLEHDIAGSLHDLLYKP